jgi:hypothetical protein
MGFDLERFSATNFSERTGKIQVPELKKFFDEDENPVWVVRSLTGEELARVHEAVANNSDVSALVSAVTSQVSGEKVEAIKSMMGLSEEGVPNDIVRRLNMLTIATVGTDFPQDMSVKLARTHPTTFYKITNRIIELTGQGQVGE